MRRRLRRGWRLVRVGISPSCLNVLTGKKSRSASRACGRARAHARARGSGRIPVETLRRRAFSLVSALLPVSTGFRGGGAGRRRHLRRGRSR